MTAPDEDVRTLGLVDEPTRSFLENALALGRVVALTIDHRERILRALETVSVSRSRDCMSTSGECARAR